MNKFAFVFGILIAVCSIPAYASCNDITYSDLSDAGVIELKQKCVEIHSHELQKKPTADLSQEYNDIGKQYGMAIAEAAKSLDMSVDELAKNQIGQTLYLIIAYKTIAKSLIGVVFGFLWFMVMIPLWIYMSNRLVLRNQRTNITYNDNGKITKREVQPLDLEKYGPMIVGLIVILVFISIAGCAMIF